MGTKEDKQKMAIWDSVEQVGDMDTEPSGAGWTEKLRSVEERAEILS